MRLQPLRSNILIGLIVNILNKLYWKKIEIDDSYLATSKINKIS